MRSLSLRNREWTEKRKSRLKQRNHGFIVVFADTRVKDIRKILLCKKKDYLAEEKKRVRLRRQRGRALEHLRQLRQPRNCGLSLKRAGGWMRRERCSTLSVVAGERNEIDYANETEWGGVRGGFFVG